MSKHGGSAGAVLVSGANIDLHSLTPLRDAGLTVEILKETLDRSEIFGRLNGFRYYLYGGEEAADQLERNDFAALATAGLQLIAFAGKGVHDFLRVADAAQEGIVVTNTPGAVEPSVAEFTVMLTLSLLRGVLAREVAWLESSFHITPQLTSAAHAALGVDIADATVGIIGMGDIGSLVARILTNGFGANVVYWSRNKKPDIEEELGIRFQPLTELLSSSDIVSLHLANSEETVKLVESIPFEAVTSSLMLVNTASQKLLPAGRLAALLSSGRISSAAFDKVYSHDQLKMSGLLSYVPERFIVTNHSANAALGAWRRMTEMAVASILAHASGSMPPGVVST